MPVFRVRSLVYLRPLTELGCKTATSPFYRGQSTASRSCCEFFARNINTRSRFKAWLNMKNNVPTHYKQTKRRALNAGATGDCFPAGHWFDWFSQAGLSTPLLHKNRCQHTLWGRATAPAHLEPPAGLQLGRGSGWSGPTCKTTIDHERPAIYIYIYIADRSCLWHKRKKTCSPQTDYQK